MRPLRCATSANATSAVLYREVSNATLERLLLVPLERGGFRARSGANAELGDLAAWRDAGPSVGSSHRLEGSHAIHPSCAVVGSSSSLLQARSGAEIDAASFVIRVNNAPLPKRFHAQLGRRTSLTVRTFSDTYPHASSAAMRSHPPLSLDPFEDHGAPTLFYCHVPYLSRCWVRAYPVKRLPAHFTVWTATLLRF